MLILLGFVFLVIGGFYFLKFAWYVIKLIWVVFFASERKVDNVLFSDYKKKDDYKQFSDKIDNLF